jgi:iron(II)-dependent oxidoreductase
MMPPVQSRDPALAAAPASPHDLKESIASLLAEARGRTLGLLEPLDDRDLVEQHSPLMSPLVWDVAHIGYFEELWLLREIGGRAPLHERHDDLYDAFRHARSERGELPLLDPAAARAYCADVRSRALDVLEEIELDPDDRLLADGFVFGLVVQHEQQHCETLLATLQLRDAEYPFADGPAPAPAAPPPDAELLVGGGPFVLGTSREPWAYDNEQPAHEVELPPFWIDTAPVANAAYLAFVDAGGYDDPRHWTEAGWAWRREARLEHPQFWRREGDGAWTRVRLGRREGLPPDEPVQHVCWYEADAFARWAGKRLPTEPEWEKAATWEAAGAKLRYPWGEAPPDPELANLGQRRFGPAPAGAAGSPWGARALVGDVWEWTASDFHGYPGFESYPYDEYSAVFFGSEYKVLRGGSWATHPVVARTTFRNWDYPVRRQIFAGFRCARDD